MFGTKETLLESSLITEKNVRWPARISRASPNLAYLAPQDRLRARSLPAPCVSQLALASAARDVGVDLVLDGFAVDGLAATLAIRGGANTFACLLTPSRFLLASPSSRRLRPRRGGRDG